MNYFRPHGHRTMKVAFYFHRTVWKWRRDQYGEKIPKFKQSYHDRAHDVSKQNVFSADGRDRYHKRRLYRTEIHGFL